MAMIGLALVVSLVLLRAVLYNLLSDDVDAQLNQEVDELVQLAGGRDPSTGQPFGGDVESLFDLFISRNVPQSGEAFFTLIGGRPYASSVTPLQLLGDPAIVAQWSAIDEPTRAELDTSGGPIRYLAVPVVPEGAPQGLFVVAHFMDEVTAALDRTIRAGGLVFGIVFALVSIYAWFEAGRVLRPIRLLTETAREIEDRNWSRRIPVQGDDEIARLAGTFNDMLDRLEDAFETQRRFIDDASHELRTPITIIRGHLELARPGAADWPQVRALVLDELDRMSRMVEDLLLLARAERPEFLDLHPIDVDEFTAEVFAKVAALSGERRWVLTAAAPAVMVADRDRLTQALMNLARNAQENSPAGSAIHLGSACEGELIRFSVRDEGPGIPPEDMVRLFDRFARGRAARRNASGAGLGLAIVRTIAEAHGGAVRVDSTPGAGSTFHLELPAGGPEVTE